MTSFISISKMIIMIKKLLSKYLLILMMCFFVVTAYLP